MPDAYQQWVDQQRAQGRNGPLPNRKAWEKQQAQLPPQPTQPALPPQPQPQVVYVQAPEAPKNKGCIRYGFLGVVAIIILGMIGSLFDDPEPRRTASTSSTAPKANSAAAATTHNEPARAQEFWNECIPERFAIFETEVKQASAVLLVLVAGSDPSQVDQVRANVDSIVGFFDKQKQQGWEGATCRRNLQVLMPGYFRCTPSSGLMDTLKLVDDETIENTYQSDDWAAFNLCVKVR